MIYHLIAARVAGQTSLFIAVGIDAPIDQLQRKNG